MFAFFAFVFFLSTSAIKITSKNESMSDSCQCREWAAAFESGDADCSAAPNSFETCTAFMHVLPNEKFCLMDPENRPKQWCYVSPECESGQPSTWKSNESNASLAWKYCSDEEVGAHKYTVSSFLNFTQENDLVAWKAAENSFPTLEPLYVADVMDFFGIQWPEGFSAQNRVAKNLTDGDRQRLQAVVDGGAPVFIKRPCNGPPYLLVEGMKAYWMDWTPFMEDVVARDDQNQMWETRFKQMDVTCVAGCEEKFPAWMSWINKINDEC